MSIKSLLKRVKIPQTVRNHFANKVIINNNYLIFQTACKNHFAKKIAFILSGETRSIEKIREIPEYSGKYEFSCNFPDKL